MKERRGNKILCFVTETWLNVLRCFKQFVLLTQTRVLKTWKVHRPNRCLYLETTTKTKQWLPSQQLIKCTRERKLLAWYCFKDSIFKHRRNSRALKWNGCCRRRKESTMSSIIKRIRQRQKALLVPRCCLAYYKTWRKIAPKREEIWLYVCIYLTQIQ